MGPPAYADGTELSCSRPEPLSILARDQERLHHLGVLEVAVELVELRQPEVVALKVECRFRRIVGIAAQVTEVLHQHKRSIELLLFQGGVFGYSSQSTRPRYQVAGRRR